jgi:Fe-S-cluster containining protein
MLDTHSGSCLIYESRPIACRTYGFYVEGKSVLGCHRIESLAEEFPDVVWGNATALEDKLQHLGPAAELHRWLDT